MVDVVVHHAELVQHSGQEMFVLSVEITKPNEAPEHFIQLVPTDTFESRAAEYHIDADTGSGWDDLMTMVLYEPHLDETTEDQLGDPDHLWNAPTVAHARKAKMAKIRRKRTRPGRLRSVVGAAGPRARLAVGDLVVACADDEDPLTFMRTHAHMSTEHVAVKTEFTRRRRNALRAQRQANSDQPVTSDNLRSASATASADTARGRRRTRESAEELAAALMGQNVGGPDDISPPIDPRMGRSRRGRTVPRETTWLAEDPDR